MKFIPDKKIASGIGSTSLILFIYFVRFSSPFVMRNPEKVIGSICIKLTFPTGNNDGLASAIPRSDPTQAI